MFSLKSRRSPSRRAQRRMILRADSDRFPRLKHRRTSRGWIRRDPADPSASARLTIVGAMPRRPAASNFCTVMTLQEIADAQSAAESCRSAGRQTRGSVLPRSPRGLGRIVADKNRTCVVYPRQRIVIVDGQMFRSDAIDPLHGLALAKLPLAALPEFVNDCLAVAINCPALATCNATATSVANSGLVVMKTTRASGSCSACATKSAAMNSRIARIAVKHRFRRTRKHVDAAIEAHQLLGGGHKLFPGPTIFSTASNGFGSIGKGGDGLRSSTAIDLAHPSR